MANKINSISTYTKSLLSFSSFAALLVMSVSVQASEIRDSNTTSDARLKEKVEDLSNSLDNITALRGVTYHWKERPEDGEQVGLIAQEVAEVYPQLVHKEEETGNLTVNYDGLVAPLIESVKELNEQNHKKERLIGELMKENQIQNKMIEQLVERLDRLEKEIQ